MNTRCRGLPGWSLPRSSLLGWLLATTLAQASAVALPPGAGRFEVTHDGQAIPVWYYLPDDAGPDAPVLMVMHGVNRDADRYRDEWLPYARRHGFLLLVPEFSDKSFPGAARYSQGNTHDADGQPLPRAQWTFRFIEPVFDAAKSATGSTSARYSLYGHSAGAQFVHRFLYFMPEARVKKAVAANAGWWTLPDAEVDYPYGLRGSGIDPAALRTMLDRELVVLLGTADNDPNHKHLRRTEQAMVQGPHRLARGQFFFQAGRNRAQSLGCHFGWRLATAPSIGHSNQGMAAFAVMHLFDR